MVKVVNDARNGEGWGSYVVVEDSGDIIGREAIGGEGHEHARLTNGT